MSASFNELLRDAIRRRGPKHPAWRYNSKIAGRELAASLGVRVPDLLSGPCSIYDMQPLDRPFVVKPNTGHSGRGVLALVPAGERKFRNVLYPLTQPSTWGVWRAWALASKREESVTQADRVRPPWLMEELIGDGVTSPDEWKFYGFANGSVPLVRQRKVRSDGISTNKFWEVWDDVLVPIDGNVETRRVIDNDLKAPPHVAEMISDAQALAAAASRPFARIDFLVSPDGLHYFGEITPEPSAGHRDILGDWDRILGLHWERACNL